MTVVFVDYGGIDHVSSSDLKCLPERFHHLPLQGIKASLHGVLTRLLTLWLDFIHTYTMQVSAQLEMFGVNNLEQSLKRWFQEKFCLQLRKREMTLAGAL